MALRTVAMSVLYGQDVGAFGGAFKVTEGLQAKFGADRVFDTPICESAMLGAAIGMATQGMRPIVELQFSDFITTAMHQLLNNAGTRHYRTGDAVPMVLRAPCGGGTGGGPFHSEELETFFCHMPGIKVVYPAFPGDARSLLLSAVQDPNPVIYMENKTIYRSAKERVDENPKALPLGKATLRHPGDDAVVIEVADDGPGIKSKHSQVVFRRYTRVADDSGFQRRGHGLGLAGARIMARCLGGEVAIVNGAESGATFQARIPVTMAGCPQDGQSTQ